jgi:hypothetical protein
VTAVVDRPKALGLPIMGGLTLGQPMASAVFLPTKQWKNVENRLRPILRDQDMPCLIAIHAGLTPWGPLDSAQIGPTATRKQRNAYHDAVAKFRRQWPEYDPDAALPTGCLLGVVEILGARNADETAYNADVVATIMQGRLDDIERQIDRSPWTIPNLGDRARAYAIGRRWPIPEPIPCRGAQGRWPLKHWTHLVATLVTELNPMEAA